MARRFGLASAGAAFCAAGGLILWLGVVRGEQTVLDAETSDFVAANVWFWPVTVLLLISVAIGGAWWLYTQSRGAALRRFALVGGARRMATRAATAELADEIVKLPGVRDVKVRFTGSSARPRLVLSVFCEESADLGLLLAHIGDTSLVWFRETVSMPELHAVLRFRLVYRETRIA